MKKILVMILFFLLVLGICGCVNLQSDKESKEDNNDNEYRYPIHFEENVNEDEFRYPICFVPND